MPADTARAFFRGFQFDTMVISYTLIVPFTLFLSFLIVSSKRYQLFIEKFVWFFCGLSIAVFLLILFIDQYFYNYFQSHINILIFGLIDDDTKAVMTSVWTDYPVIKIFMLWSCMLSAYAVYVKKLYRRRRLRIKMPMWANISGAFVVLAALILGVRQSVSTFPLQSHDITVSTSQSINFLATNGVYALKTAFSEREKAQSLKQTAIALVHQLGYQDAASAARDHFNKTALPEDLSDEDAVELMFSRTPSNSFLEKNKSNVVFVFMESMSNYNMMLNAKQVDVMGRLKPHFRSDIVFRNFVSSGNNTVQSLEFLLTNSPISLTQSKYRFQRLPTGTALPFKNSGYETTFVTGGEISWRNIHELAPNQGFARLFGRRDIYTKVKNTQGNHWGAYDEFLFDFAYKQLSAKSSKPQFMFIQTTSNHTPFDLPATYKPGPIELPDHTKKQLLVEEELAIKNLRCLQYGNDCLGAFLDRIKQSPLSKNTIVVASGDHNNLMLFDFDESKQLAQRGVPLYMYVPKDYRPKTAVDTSRYGSHKDIFPTIYNIALSGARYFKAGNNLFDQQTQQHFYGMNLSSFTAFSAEAAVNYSPSAVFYRSKNKLLTKDSNCRPAHELMIKARSGYALSVFAIVNSLAEPTSGEHKKSTSDVLKVRHAVNRSRTGDKKGTKMRVASATAG